MLLNVGLPELRFASENGRPLVVTSRENGCPLDGFFGHFNGSQTAEAFIKGESKPCEERLTFILTGDDGQPCIREAGIWVDPKLPVGGDKTPTPSMGMLLSGGYSNNGGMPLIRTYWTTGAQGFGPLSQRIGDKAQKEFGPWILSPGMMTMGLWLIGDQYTIPVLIYVDHQSNPQVFTFHNLFPADQGLLRSGEVAEDTLVLNFGNAGWRGGLGTAEGMRPVTVTRTTEEGGTPRLEVVPTDPSKFFVQFPRHGQSVNALSRVRYDVWGNVEGTRWSDPSFQTAKERQTRTWLSSLPKASWAPGSDGTAPTPATK